MEKNQACNLQNGNSNRKRACNLQHGNSFVLNQDSNLQRGNS